MSLAGVYDAEWRKRKINLLNVLRSFVAQLTPGQDLTKVSLPSELCHPFSMLELIAYRELALFHIVFEINKLEDKFERFLQVVRWYLGLLREETIEKKPFNPVIEETHQCWVRHGDQDDDFSEFVGEQVSHHPPVSAFIVRNKKNQIFIQGDVTFSVGFGSNSASVNTAGHVTIRTAKESYTMSKVMPNMVVNNIIWGVKYVMWTGSIDISCPETGYTARLDLKEVDKRNQVSGYITKIGSETELFQLHGIAGGKTFLHAPGELAANDRLLFDFSAYTDNKISYFPPEVQAEFESMKLWQTVKDAIIKNDMLLADAAKKKIEAAQRVREAKRRANQTTTLGQCFTFVPNSANTPVVQQNVDLDKDGDVVDLDQKGHWEFNNNVLIDCEVVKEMEAKAAVIRSEIEQREKEEREKHQDETGSDQSSDNGDCSIS